jgi:hypothetical protein
MNKDKLKELVNALDALSDDVKDMQVYMRSISKPSDDTCGCHAGLISIVAQELPELQEIYEPIYSKECDFRGQERENHYIFYVWNSALAIFLGFKHEYELDMWDEKNPIKIWAEDNPEIWGNNFGGEIFSSQSAFNNDLDKALAHRDIIEHWKQVLANIEKGV